MTALPHNVPPRRRNETSAHTREAEIIRLRAQLARARDQRKSGNDLDAFNTLADVLVGALDLMEDESSARLASALRLTSHHSQK